MYALIKQAAVAATLLLFSSFAGSAHELKHGDLVLMHHWVRATPEKAPTSAGYLIIRNTGKTADRLASVESSIARKTEIHTMTMDGGVMRMRQLVDGLEIPAGGEVALKPGGEHIMFMGLNGQVEEGSDVTVRLNFEKAGPVDVTFPVQKKDNHMKHGTH
ncbi:MAG: copper chaperone PCu(A)C [Rhodospirillales bacterium]